MDTAPAPSPVPLVFARPKPHSDLQPGDILIGHFGLTYLTEKTGAISGYDKWDTVRYTAPGSAVHSHTELRADGTSTVLEFIPQAP